MSKHYETMFILKPTLTEEEAKAKVDLFSEIITKGGGEIAAVESLGTRPLAYKIKKFERGIYTVIYFTADGALNKELERNYRINEDVLRFIVIRYDRQVEIGAWENMVNRAKGLPFKEFKLSESAREPREYRPRRPRREEPVEASPAVKKAEGAE
jgi:small subunit ribosomal protein S6